MFDEERQPGRDEEEGEEREEPGAERADAAEGGRKPPPDDLTEDPAYEPQDDELKGIKGG
jgi:hypothetical protein